MSIKTPIQAASYNTFVLTLPPADDFDQARITDPASTPSPSPCEEAFALPTHLKDDLEALPDILDDMRTLSQSTPVNSPSLTPRPGSELEHQDPPVAETPLQTALKRSRSPTEDQDQDGSVYTKKPRIYTIEDDHSDIEEITRTLVNPALNDEAGRSLDKNSQLALAEHKHERWAAARPTPRHEAPPHKDARNHTPNKQKDKTPNLLSLLSKQPHPRPTCNSKRPRTRTHPTLAEQTASRDRFARLIRPYNPAPRSSSPDACTNPAHSHSRPTAVTNININTAAAAAFVPTPLPSVLDLTACSVYSLIPGLELGLGSAAPVVLKLSIPAILRSTNTIRSTLFIANTTYRDQRFVCHAC